MGHFPVLALGHVMHWLMKLAVHAVRARQALSCASVFAGLGSAAELCVARGMPTLSARAASVDKSCHHKTFETRPFKHFQQGERNIECFPLQKVQRSASDIVLIWRLNETRS